MEYILGYLKYMLLSIPIIIIIRLIINRNKKTDIKKEVLFTIFISFVVGLYSQAL